MSLFGQAKDLYKLQKQAKEIKKQLKDIHIETEGDIAITVNGEQNFIQAIPQASFFDGIDLSEAQIEKLTKKINSTFVDQANKAIKKSQTIGAQKMQEVMGGLGGMFGKG